MGVGDGKAVVSTVAPTGSGFTVTPGDLAFILKQIKIAEQHAATLTPANPCGSQVGDGPNQITDAKAPQGLRTVDGSCNNLFAGRETFAASQQPFPRLTPPKFRDAEAAPAGFPPQPSSSYKQKKGFVYDSQPRVISNLIVDQTSTNPAAVAAAGFPVRTQGNPGIVPCTTDPTPTSAGIPAGCTPSHQTLFIPNVTTDVGLSPPYNSMFTFFGQFFDHGVDQTVKSGGTVFVPLKADDPLIAGPDHILGNGDDLPASQRFMVLTRAQNQPGPDGIVGDDPATAVDESADDIQNATNTDTPLVDQSQTYTSHPSHQFFLREYALNSAGRPVSTGKLLGGINHTADTAGAFPGVDGTTGMATWENVKRQAATLLGLRLTDRDVTAVPMIATDPYGKFIPGPARGLPQYVTTANTLVEGNVAAPVAVPANVRHFDIPFVGDIAHNADPSPRDTDNNPATPPVAPTPDADNVASADFANQPAGTYDDEMLNAHFCAGDGRVNENIALTAVHQIFHSEHDRLVDDIKNTLNNDTSASGIAALQEWSLASGAGGWNGERLFQAARFVTEMEYQHLVFEEFARKIQPAIRPFGAPPFGTPDLNPTIPAEFAHAVYRFGHSMLDDTLARTTEDPVTGVKTDNSVTLLKGFLNPPEFFNGGADGLLNPEQAAGQIFMGSVDQAGNEMDEFVIETLRNNLLGLPLDLPTINMTRAREAGVPPLNVFRRQIYEATNDSQLRPYGSWAEYGQALKHPESLINFVAAYGKHPTITGATTLVDKRNAARAIVDPQAADPVIADRNDFLFSSGVWANNASAESITGLDEVDLWVGGLAEITNVFGGLLGSTFNYVFQTTLENLQDGDRFYYLARTPGMNLRSQLEGNSFAELVQRNTQGTHSLKADVFATADCKMELKNLAGTAAGFTQFGSTVADDPLSDCDESALLLRRPDGTLQYRQFNSVDPSGINAQSVYNGTPAVDRVVGGNDNDTFWGGEGADIIDGNGGDDVVLGGDGNDRVTDLDGADVLKGGPGNDALDAGTGDDIMMGGDGADMLNGQSGTNEMFLGPGDDFAIGGGGLEDEVLGDGGDDWIQGGPGFDLLIGDHSAPFFDDMGDPPGNDVLVGQVGDNDFDSEGGDDIMGVQPGIDKNSGNAGWDWVSHQYDTVGANDDISINQLLVGVPLPVVTNRDRWSEVEAISGSALDDLIKGDDVVPSLVGGAGFIGCNALDQDGLDRILGLDAIVPPLTGDAAAVAAISETSSKTCPLSGPIWGEGNILIGGAGNDTLEGRGGDDIIDGDRMLRVRISVRTNPADPATEIGSTDLLEHQYLRDASGALTGPTLQAAVFAGTVDPANLAIVREIVIENPGGADTAVFSGNRADYDITVNGPVVTVAGGALTDGVDTLRNIEFLHFADGTIATPTVSDLAPAVSLSATSISFGDQAVGTTSAAQTVTVTNSGNAPLDITDVLSEEIEGDDPAVALDFAIDGAGTTCTPPLTLAPGATCNVEVTFTPSATGLRRAELQIQSDAAGSPHNVALSGNGVAAPAPAVTTAPTAAAGLTFAAELVGATSASQPVTVTNSGNAPLTVNSLTIAGLDFSVASSTCLAAPVAAGASCTVNVRFTPQAAGARSSSLSIASNAAGSPNSVPLAGTGATASLLAGNQAVEAKLDSNAPGLAEAFRTTAATTGSVRQLRVFVDTGNTATSLVAGLYAHNAATNRPGTLLTSGSLVGLTAGQFNTVTVPAANVTAGTTYWIAILGPSGTLRFRDRGNVGAANAVVSSQTTLTALPGTWSSGAAFTDGALSGWAAGILSTTAPPPPPPPPATGLSVLVGNAATEAKIDSNAPGLAEAFKTTAATTGTVSRLRVFVDAGSTAGSVVVGLYSNVAGNHPGTLLTSGTISAPVAGQNNEVAVTAASVTAGQTYWIAVLGPTGTLKFRDRGAVGAGNSETSAQATLTSLPATWTTGASFADGLLSAVGLG